MPTRTIAVDLTAAQDSVLSRDAVKANTQVETLLAGILLEHARSRLAQYEKDLLALVPRVWDKATPQEKAQLATKLEEIAAR